MNNTVTSWNEIKTQDDIIEFMKKFISFHDSCIREIRYISGTYIHEDSMIVDTRPFMNIIFDTPIDDSSVEFELGFVDKFSINIDLNGALIIYDSSFIKKDDGFYWYSNEYADENSEYMFRCQTIRWGMVPYSKQA